MAWLARPGPSRPGQGLRRVSRTRRTRGYRIRRWGCYCLAFNSRLFAIIRQTAKINSPAEKPKAIIPTRTAFFAKSSFCGREAYVAINPMPAGNPNDPTPKQSCARGPVSQFFAFAAKRIHPQVGATSRRMGFHSASSRVPVASMRSRQSNQSNPCQGCPCPRTIAVHNAYRRSRLSKAGVTMRISLIIPAWNEERFLPTVGERRRGESSVRRRCG